MTSREQYIVGIKKMGHFLGKKHLLSSLDGKKLTQQQAIWAHCYDCQGGYSDGAEDCMSDICPLRPFMPYNENRRKAPVTNPDGNAESLAKIRKAKVEQNTAGLDEYDEMVGQDEKSA